MAPTQVQRAVDVAERELTLSWATVAAVVLLFAGRLLLEGTASLTQTVSLVAYAAVVTASAFVRVRRWAGIWFLWAAFVLHFALTFSAAGMGSISLVLLLVAGVLVALGVQDVRGELER
ncbi:hypothetical protein [Haloterrigena salinisoli]|uniref:hypothetical protein n=1 Tax=Haloterrigena salinisoli TaxID=3132747 RepID=UPI0030D4BF6C